MLDEKQILEADVTELGDFLTSGQRRPLITVGSGGTFAVADFAALLYSAAGGVGMSVTPYTLQSFSDRSLENSKILLISDNEDTDYIAQRLIDVNPDQVALFSLRGGSQNIFTKNSFILPVDYDQESALAYFPLLCRAFGYNLEQCPENEIEFSMIFNDGTDLSADDLKTIDSFALIYGGWGRPIAVKTETDFCESGLLTSMVCDYKNFCNGRYIYTSNHLSDSAVIMFVTPRDRDMVEEIRNILPDKAKLILMQTGEDSPLAAMDLLQMETAFFNTFCQIKAPSI